MNPIDQVPDAQGAFEDESFERAAVDFVARVRQQHADDTIEREMGDFLDAANAATEAEEAAGWEEVGRP